MFKDYLKNNNVLLDGAMGTMLQRRGHKLGEFPETLNVTKPQAIIDIHAEYVRAGARVLYANTFGANGVKLAGSGYTAPELITAGVRLCREAAGENAFVALDIGPTGQLIDNFGTLKFEDAYNAFREAAIAGERAGCDLAVIETMTDLSELRAAVLAVKENTALPVVATMTFEGSGRTFTGVTPAAFAVTATGLSVDALGVNCSLGPRDLYGIVEELAEYTDLPLVVKANAGLPDMNGVYSVSPADFARACARFLSMGVSVIGGCCGTTPEYTAKLSGLLSGTVPKKRKPIKKRLVVCSAVRTLTVDRPVIVGERLNPTGKKAYREALSRGDYGYVSAQAIEQEDAGADILDINAGVPGEDETELMLRAISAVGAVTVLPLQIDSSDARCVDAALRRYAGKAIVNSVNGDDEVLDRILPVVKKYGAAVIGLTLDKRGIPQNASARVKIAEKIIAAASRYGIGRENVIIDALTLTAAAEQAQAAQTLDALGRIKRLGVKTALGVSNISFGMPGREHVNAAFLTLALERGLDLAIMNPNIESARAAFRAYCVLKNIDKKAEKYISDYSVSASSVPPEGVGTPDIAYCIRKGLKSTGFAVRKALESKTPLEVIDGELIPALDAVGRDFESGKLYLPQLIASAESAKIGFDELKKAFPKETGGNAKGTVMLATVKGDIHDIGKNIVKTVLENYGFDVIDLGRNVDIKDVVDAVCRHNIKLLGLSALMTTTVANMKDTITAVRQAAPDCVIMVGGAVLTADYARAIGADFYGKDAVSSARFAGTVFAKA